MSRGVSNTEHKGYTYLSFMSGKFVERVAEGTKGAESRELKKGPNAGKVVHELKYDKLGGQILKMETEASDYGKQLHVYLDIETVETPGVKAKLSLSLSSGPAKGLLSRLPVIDLAKDVELRGFHIEKKDKPGTFGTYLVPYQDDKKLESYYTKEDPKGLPEMVKIKVKGQETWDDSDQLEFFESLIASTNFPGLDTAPVVSSEQPEEYEEEEDLIQKTGKPTPF